MKRQGFALLLVVLLSVPTHGSQFLAAQDDVISLGGFELRLGMDQEDALRKLGTIYTMTHSDSANLWLVQRKGRSPWLVGSLSFVRGKLVHVNKQWGPESSGQTASGLAKALSDAVRTLPARTTRSCALSVASLEGIEQTVIQCGNRTPWVNAASDSKYSSNVVEVISGSQ